MISFSLFFFVQDGFKIWAYCRLDGDPSFVGMTGLSLKMEKGRDGARSNNLSFISTQPGALPFPSIE